jgi:transposase
MPKTIKEERLRWIEPILKKELRIIDLIKTCPHSERSIKRWLASFRKYGEVGLIPKSTRPKSHPNETPIRIKERVIELREEKKECALKIKWYLEDENIELHERTVGKILKNEGLVKKYRVKKIRYKYIRANLLPGEMIEIDVKYVPGKVEGKRYFQFTAIDLSSRWRHLEIYDQQSNGNSIKFLETIIKKAPFKIKSIKTDNHAIFTNRYTGYLKSSDPLNPRLHSLDRFCAEVGIIHYLIDKGTPTQNGTVERSHGSDQRRLYSQEKFINADYLKYRVKLWNMYYNDLRHCSLNGKSPNEFLKKSNYLINTGVTNVCA